MQRYINHLNNIVAIHSKYFFPIICRFFQSTAYYWGREQSPSTPKCAPSPEGTRSKIEHRRVQKRRELKNLSAFFVFLRHKGGSKNSEFRFYLFWCSPFRPLFVPFGVILSSLICHIARYAPSSTYKSTHENRTKINATEFLEHP